MRAANFGSRFIDKTSQKAYTIYMITITNEDTLLQAIEEYGILPFWDEHGFAASQMSGVSFMKLWNIREKVVNSEKIVYGKFINKKSTFVSKSVFPFLCALRRDGYDFDSLTDEGKAPRREIDVMNAVGTSPAPQYELGKSLGMKGYDTTVTSLQNKTYLCVTFKKSYMGTALLSRPEDVFGYDYVRGAYGLTAQENIDEIVRRAKGIAMLDEKIRNKALAPAV